MAGFSKIVVVGDLGGFQGADGVNPIHFIILVGNADRQWLEVKYFDPTIVPIGKVRTIIPEGPDDPASLLDACLAFGPASFRSCPSLAEVEAALRDIEVLDFGQGKSMIPSAWTRLRQEARPFFEKFNIWEANLEQIMPLER
jgi:hypothetical protein